MDTPEITLIGVNRSASGLSSWHPFECSLQNFLNGYRRWRRITDRTVQNNRYNKRHCTYELTEPSDYGHAFVSCSVADHDPVNGKITGQSYGLDHGLKITRTYTFSIPVPYRIQRVVLIVPDIGTRFYREESFTAHCLLYRLT